MKKLMTLAVLFVLLGCSNESETVNVVNSEEVGKVTIGLYAVDYWIVNVYAENKHAGWYKLNTFTPTDTQYIEVPDVDSIYIATEKNGDVRYNYIPVVADSVYRLN